MAKLSEREMKRRLVAAADKAGFERARELAAQRVECFHDFSERYDWKPALNLNDGRDQLRWYANGVRALPYSPPDESAGGDK